MDADDYKAVLLRAAGNERGKPMPHFDRFDVCEAWYMYAALHHGGQGSAEYRILSRLMVMGYKPRPRLRGIDDLSENAYQIYLKLAREGL